MARALAILGMVIVHFVLAMAPGEQEPAWLRTTVDLLDGRARALFVVLAPL